MMARISVTIYSTTLQINNCLITSPRCVSTVFNMLITPIIDHINSQIKQLTPANLTKMRQKKTHLQKHTSPKCSAGGAVKFNSAEIWPSETPRPVERAGTTAPPDDYTAR
jgi:hypothetical protein